MWLDDHKKSFYKAWWETKFQPAALKRGSNFPISQGIQIGIFYKVVDQQILGSKKIPRAKKRGSKLKQFQLLVVKVKPEARPMDIGTMQEMKATRERLQCHDMEPWFTGAKFLEDIFEVATLLISFGNEHIYPIKNGENGKSIIIFKSGGQGYGIVPKRVSWFVIEVAKLVAKKAASWRWRLVETEFLFGCCFNDKLSYLVTLQ